MRILANVIAAMFIVAGLGVIGYAVMVPNLYSATSAIQQGAVYAMGTHYSAIGIGLILFGGVIAMATIGSEIVAAVKNLRAAPNQSMSNRASDEDDIRQAIKEARALNP